MANPRPTGTWTWLWMAALVILAVAAVDLAVRWDEIPDRFPTHWNARGEADHWTDRSLGIVVLPLLLGAGSCAFLTLLAWGIGRLEWGGKRSPERRAIEARLLNQILGVCAVGMSILFAVIALQPLRPHPEELPPGFGWWMGAGIAAVLVLVVWRSHVASRRLDAIEPAPPDERDSWRWGSLVYVNSQDSRLFVPKRLGFGWTLNFGRPASWLVLAILLLPALLVLLPVFAE